MRRIFITLFLALLGLSLSACQFTVPHVLGGYLAASIGDISNEGVK